DLLTGDVYFASQVVGTLVDQIGSLDVAIERALFLAKTSTKNKMAKTKTKTTALALAAGVDAFEISDGSISLNEDQIASVEAALDSVTEFRAKQSAIADAAAAQIAALEKDLAAAKSAAAGAQTATANPAFDGQAPISADPASDFVASINSARTFLK
ncbi:MAG: hypothetical protein RRY42_06720, partial [Mucinivorans sp.]